MKVLMVGATGQFAHMVVPELKRRNVTVRALVRDEVRAATARRQGSDETVIGDLGDPVSLRTAADGVDGVFSLTPAFAPDESQMGMAMVEAARAAGVKKFVFQSVMHPSLMALVNHTSKLPVEGALYDSGMDYTVFQPAMFMQNLKGAWPGVVDNGLLAMPYSKTAKACYVDYRDVAEAIALALTDVTLSYGTFELCAPGMVNRVQLAAMMSAALGRDVEAGELDRAQWARGLPDSPMGRGLAHMMAHYDEHGFPGGNSVVLRTVLGRDPRTLEQYVGELAGQELRTVVGAKTTR
jgi:uncharacterized protein YbjT (DUF2867 family)